MYVDALLWCDGVCVAYLIVQEKGRKRMQGHGRNYIERSNFPVHGLRFLGGDNFSGVLLVENRPFPAGCVGLPVHPWRKHLAFTNPDLPILPTDIYKV